jgi:outer membrane protein assembly factor BamB
MRKLIITLFVVTCCFAEGYSQITSEWRGPGRTGVYNEKGLLKKWPEGGPQLLWSVKDLPKGNSSVGIGKNKLYLTGTKDSVEVLIALDLSGKKIWETSFGRAWTASFPESRCTPTIDGDRIYVTTGKLDAACIDAGSGKIIWAVKVNDKFEGAYGMWGKSESPLVIGNKVFFTPAGNSTTMVALDKFTGETIWKSESLSDGSSYVSPLVIERNGKQEIIGMTEKYAFAVNPDDGKIIWKYNYSEATNPPARFKIQINTPLYSNGNIFLSNGYDQPSVMLQLSEDGSSVKPLWIEKVLDIHHGGMVHLDSYIFGSNWENNAKGKWVCLDWNTGKTLYETEWINKGQIISADGLLYCYEEKSGNIALVKPTPEKFEIISSFKIPMGSGVHWSHPVINQGILYVRHMDAFMAYNLKQ